MMSDNAYGPPAQPTRRHPMSQREVVEHVMTVLDSSDGSIRASDLFGKLNEEHITSSEGRRALLHLADERQIEITPDRRVRRLAQNQAGNVE